MTWNSVIRRTLLLPIHPRAFRIALSVLRATRWLQRRGARAWPPREILVVNLTPNVGDSIMMLPTLDALHRIVPAASIDVVVEGPMADALSAAPIIRRVFRFESAKTKLPLLGHYLRVASILSFARAHLGRRSYDLAVLPRWGTDPGFSVYLAAASSAPRRCGHDPKEELGTKEVLPGITQLMTCVAGGGQGMAEAVREQLVLAACGFPFSIDPDTEERRPVESVLQMSNSLDSDACLRRLGIEPGEQFVLIAPGASHPARCWPVEQFVQLGVRLSNGGLRIYAFGSSGDSALGEKLFVLSKGIIRNIAGETSILEGLVVIQRAALLVTNDSGPAHMGGSLGTPTLVLSACPTTSKDEHVNSPLRVRPVGPNVVVLQPNDNAPGCVGRCKAVTAHCIRGLEVDKVAETAKAMLNSVVQPGSLRMLRSTLAGAPAATE